MHSNVRAFAAATFALAVTATVTHAQPQKYTIADKVTVWTLDVDDPQDNIPFRYPHPFISKEACEAFIETPEGQRTIINVRLYVLRQQGPDYKLGEPLCRPQEMDLPRRPGIDL